MSEPQAQTAPPWPIDLRWLGVEAAPRLRDRVAVLLFWSSTDVHSLEALPILSWLQLRFAGHAFVAVAVHSPLRAEEGGEDRVRDAVLREGLRIPVAVDERREVFAAYGAERWPTLVVLDAAGKVRFQGSGVPDRQRLAVAVETLLDSAYGEVEEPAFWPGQDGVPSRPASVTELRRPAGLAVDAANGLLWIADSARHRLVAAELDSGLLRTVVGTGRPGSADGDPSMASFARPAGLCCLDGIVFVADRGNHLVRVVDLDRYGVTSLLGQCRAVADTVGGRSGYSQGIASPVDCAVVDDKVYVAMAGTHQVWEVSQGDGYATAWAGSGVSGSQDGMRQDAALAQPEGLAVDGARLAIADSASGAVRIGEFDSQHVWTVVDADAVGGPVQPTGLAWFEGDLLVCDALGDRLLRVDVDARTVRTLVGPGTLRGPRAVAVHDGRIFVADTDHDRVVTVDAKTGEVTPFELVDPHPDHPEPESPPTPVQSRSTLALCFPTPIPPGERIDDETAVRAWVRVVDGWALSDSEGSVEREGEWGVLRDVPTGPEGQGRVRALVRYATLADVDAVPHVQELATEAVFEAVAGASEVVDLHFPQ